MEGENNKQTFKKNILDIPSVLSGRVRPLLNAIAAKKKEVAATSDKISKIVNDIYDRQEEEALKERAAQEAAARAAAQKAAEEAAKNAPAPEQKPQVAEPAKEVMPEPAAPAKEEAKEPAVETTAAAPEKSAQDKPSKPEKPKQSTVYINPDLLGGQQRPQRQGDRRPPRPGQENRPPQQRPQGGRPTPGMRAEQVQAPVNPGYNKDKKNGGSHIRHAQEYRCCSLSHREARH